MDLHIVGPPASPAERAAVDAVLGPPTSGWDGGERDARLDGRYARGGSEARAWRHLLLPALESVQARIGWISEPALNYVCRRLSVPPAEAYGVASFYALLSLRPRPRAVVHVCDDIVCRLGGAERLCDDLARTLGPEGEPIDGGRGTWLRSPCLGLCERGPAAMLTVAGERPLTELVGPSDAAGLVARLEADRGGEMDATPWAQIVDPATSGARLRASVPQLGEPGLRILARIGRVDPASVDAYRASGGYEGLRRALELGAGAVVDEVVASGLVGRGGAAFPTGRKWAAVAAAPVRPHYLVCNADESEPGTFKDRILLEEDPFAVLEGMTIAAFATGCERGYLYVRGEYPAAAGRMAVAVERARAAGLLGDDILGSGVRFDVEIRRGAGAYVCGEETALFQSIEGYRGEPRNKPPFPVEAGLFGKPTVINNVETIANVPLILREGAAAYARVGTDESRGPKLFCLSGHVVRPGLYEVAFGATVRELLDLAGGVPGGRAVRAVLLGGAAGTFVGPGRLDMALTFEGTRAASASLGSGVVIVFDQTTDLVDIVLRIAAFFRDESCGQCVPCRIGTARQEELLHRLAAGRPNGAPEDEVALLGDLARAMRDASICGLGQTAANAAESAVGLGLFSRGASS